MALEVTTPDQVEAAPTPRLTLKQRRDELVSDLFIDLQVPRWDNPEIFVRYKPVVTSKVADSAEKRSSSKDPDWLVLANADILAQCCVGIYGIYDEDGIKRSFNVNDELGQWTVFDPNLATCLEVSPQLPAAQLVRKLYLSDGDVIAAADAVSNWSTLESKKASEDFPRP